MKIEQRSYQSIACGLLFLAVFCGAFGAHALKASFSAYAMDVYRTAVLYHGIHALGILILSGRNGMALPCLLHTLGIVFFSGSLYTLAITNVRWLGAITPIGGVLFLCGWGLATWVSIRTPQD